MTMAFCSGVLEHCPTSPFERIGIFPILCSTRFASLGEFHSIVKFLNELLQRNNKGCAALYTLLMPHYKHLLHLLSLTTTKGTTNAPVVAAACSAHLLPQRGYKNPTLLWRVLATITTKGHTKALAACLAIDLPLTYNRKG